MKITIFPGKYHQNGGFSMAMLVYRGVPLYGAVNFPGCTSAYRAFKEIRFVCGWCSSLEHWNKVFQKKTAELTYTPEVQHGTWKSAPGKDIPFGSPLKLWGDVGQRITTKWKLGF